MGAIGALLVLATYAATPTPVPSMEGIRLRVREVTLSYDRAEAEALLDDLKTRIGSGSPADARMALAKTALLVAELNRMDYEVGEYEPRERRALGRKIDAAAHVGHDMLKGMEPNSETYRLTADLYGTMIRSTYQGKRFGKKMEKASDMALSLDPANPMAYVTASKRALFASDNRGGDVPQALKLLSRALMIDPHCERALLFRGIAYDKLGNVDFAVRDWKQVLDLNPQCRPARENLETVVASQASSP